MRSFGVLVSRASLCLMVVVVRNWSGFMVLSRSLWSSWLIMSTIELSRRMNML